MRTPLTSFLSAPALVCTCFSPHSIAYTGVWAPEEVWQGHGGHNNQHCIHPWVIGMYGDCVLYPISSLYTASFGSNLSSLEETWVLKKTLDHLCPPKTWLWTSIRLSFWQRSYDNSRPRFWKVQWSSTFFVMINTMMLIWSKSKWVQLQTLIPHIAHMIRWL